MVDGIYLSEGRLWLHGVDVFESIVEANISVEVFFEVVVSKDKLEYEGPAVYVSDEIMSAIWIWVSSKYAGLTLSEFLSLTFSSAD